METFVRILGETDVVKDVKFGFRPKEGCISDTYRLGAPKNLIPFLSEKPLSQKYECCYYRELNKCKYKLLLFHKCFQEVNFLLNR